MTHTLGPWYVSRNQDTIYSKETGQLIADVRCNVWNNSRVVAAAPDLLEACEAFVTAWEQCLQLEKTDVALRMAKAAIAKAKGQST